MKTRMKRRCAPEPSLVLGVLVVVARGMLVGFALLTLAGALAQLLGAPQ